MQVEQIPQPPDTIARLFLHQARQAAQRPATVALERPGKIAGLSGDELRTQVQHFAEGLISLPIDHNDVVIVIVQPGAEFAVAQLGCWLAGAVPLLLDGDVSIEVLQAYLIATSTRTLIVGNREHAEVAVSWQRKGGPLRRVIGWGHASSIDGVLPFGQLCIKGAEHYARDPRALERRIALGKSVDPAVLIAEDSDQLVPPLVQLTQDNCCFAAASLAQTLKLNVDDYVVLLLSTHGSLKQLLGLLLCLASGAHAASFGEIDEVVAVTELHEPTVVLIDAATLERLHREIEARLLRGPAYRRILMAWATRVGAEAARRRVVGQNIDFWVSAEYWLADRLVLSEIRRLLGGKVRRIIVVHGVPMRQTRWFFEAAGASPLQLFGRPETTGIGLCEPPDMPRPGSLGRSMAEVETSVDDTGQVFSAGRHIAEARLVILANKEKGYSAQLSACPQVQTDGRLDLGVAGELDEDGFIWAEPPLGPLDAPSLAVLPIGFADNGN